jgi:hypothetical protein
MNTTNLPINMYDLTIMQLVRFVSSSDLDASEFGTRYVLYLSLLAKNNRTEAEQKYMATLMGALGQDYSNEAFRQHLSEVLRGKEVA